MQWQYTAVLNFIHGNIVKYLRVDIDKIQIVAFPHYFYPRLIILLFCFCHVVLVCVIPKLVLQNVISNNWQMMSCENPYLRLCFPTCLKRIHFFLVTMCGNTTAKPVTGCLASVKERSCNPDYHFNFYHCPNGFWERQEGGAGTRRRQLVTPGAHQTKEGEATSTLLNLSLWLAKGKALKNSWHSQIACVISTEIVPHT